MKKEELQIIKDILYNSDKNIKKRIVKNTIYTYNYVVMLLLLGNYDERYIHVVLELDSSFSEIGSEYRRLETLKIGDEVYNIPKHLGRIDFWKLIFLLKEFGFRYGDFDSRSKYRFLVNSNDIKEIIESNESKIESKSKIRKYKF